MKRPGVDARLSGLAAEHALADGAVVRLRALLDLLAEDPGASTAVRDPAAGVDIHVADALSGLPFLPPGIAADLGSGNGIPGLVLAIARPSTHVALVEAGRRKGEFLRRAVELTETPNVEVVTVRAEEWREGLETCDAVTARALAALPVVAEYAAPLLRPAGRLLAWKGVRDPAEEAAAAAAAEILGLRVGPVHHVEPFPGARHHHLHLYEKVTPTPDRFPRRAGMAVKRPLGGA